MDVPSRPNRGQKPDRLESLPCALTCAFVVERVTGIEPAFSAWEAYYSNPVTCGLAAFQRRQDALRPRYRVHLRSTAVNVGQAEIGSNIGRRVLSFSG